MKKVKWVIDKYLFEEYEEKLPTSIRNSGMDVMFFDYMKTIQVDDFFKKHFTDEDIVIFHGSHQHGRRISKLPVYPGVFLTLENYECYKYYGYFGDHLLNSNYIMMYLEMLKEFLIHSKNVFIRPSNGYKSFTGQLLPKDNFHESFDILTKSYGGLDMSLLVLLSLEQDIEEEYRFIVVDGELISGALYMDKESRNRWEPYYDKPCNDLNAIEFANIMSKIYQPDMAYNIDICKLKTGEYKIMELNSFCCGSMYGNDYDKVVNKINQLCVDFYNDLFNS